MFSLDDPLWHAVFSAFETPLILCYMGQTYRLERVKPEPQEPAYFWLGADADRA